MTKTCLFGVLGKENKNKFIILIKKKLHFHFIFHKNNLEAGQV